MVTIIRDNSYSQITGLTPEQFKGLRKALSYTADPKSAYYTGGFTQVKYMIDKKGFFPSGLLPRVRKHLVSRTVVWHDQDKRVQPPMPKTWSPLSGIAPYKAQLDALVCAEAYKQGILSMPTGSGKSLVIALIASRFNLKTLVVVPNIEIREQLKSTLKAMMADSSKVTVENIDSTRLAKLTGFDVLIIDEAHHVSASTYQRLNRKAWAGIYYRFMLTATPFRNQEHEMLLFEGIAGQVIYKLSYQEAVASRYIVPVEAYYIESPKQPTEATTWQGVYRHLVVQNQARNELIATLMMSLKASGSSTLCLVKEIAHGQALSELTGIPFANGQDEDTRAYITQFNTGKIKALIGTTGIIGEGVDTKSCEYAIIAGLGKAKSAFMQQVGRAVRTYPGKESAKVILIKDKSHKWTLTHFNAQRTILKEEYGVEPIKIEV